MKRATILVVAALLVLAGCGGDEGDEGGEGANSSPPVSLQGTVNAHGTKTASGKFEVELDDNYFAPTYIKATAGQQMTVELHNEGSTPHTFTIAGSVDEELQPGAKKTITITAPQSGSITFMCRFHQLLGMQGALFVA